MTFEVKRNLNGHRPKINSNELIPQKLESSTKKLVLESAMIKQLASMRREFGAEKTDEAVNQPWI